MSGAKKKLLKYIFVVGGVMSGVGKGVASSSIGKILQARGFKVTAVKIDPYVNVDAGTMNPTEHGEVFVLDDGMECDQDMGNYERFLGVDLSSKNYMTTGSVYQAVITRERNLEYGGKCVEVVPHIPLEVIGRIDAAAANAKADVITIEIGGTVGEYQNLLFLEALRMLKLKKPDDVISVLVSYLPVMGADSEQKTKPTQYAVRTLNASGVQPDFILARASMPIDKKRKEKIAFNCNVREEDVISAPDAESIYEVPANFEKDNLSNLLLEKLHLTARGTDLKEWRALAERIHGLKKPVRIGMVGKYFGTGDFILADSYISVIEAVKHAAYAVGRKPVIEWLNAEDFDPAINKKSAEKLAELKHFDGIVVPGGFGSRGVEGKINVIKFCREEKIPYFGLCYGMQLLTVEFARHVSGLEGAHTTEVNQNTPHPVIDILPEQKKNMQEKNYGATMRLGAYPAVLAEKTIAYAAYGQQKISERHRHRYEVNPEYVDALAKKGLVFSGSSPNRKLMEIAELPASQHPFFLGTQFHPEFKSRPLAPHPLFLAFVKAAARER
ncbi:MAG: CTP synthase [Candidatus Harrisonbacteria bacterium]|nr:CTP synthase [Candidatus Harrisonbacteria bacterium]